MGEKTISGLRDRIDSIDAELCRIIASRMRIIHEVAEFKKNHGLARIQPERENEILEKSVNLAQELNINPQTIKEIMKILIDEAHSTERRIMGK